MRSEDYLPIQGWMRDLDLTDKQLLIYALIWSYSRDGRSCWRGTAKHLADWAGCKERNAQYIVRQLEDKGLVGHDVVTWSNGRKGGVRSEFWAVTPDRIANPVKGSRSKINWAGKCRGLTQRIARGGNATDCVTPHNGIKVFKDNTGGGGKYTARSRAKSTTTTGFLFENEIDIPAPLKASPLFMDAWAKLLRQPGWTEKTPDALEIVLGRLDEVNDPIQAAWCCLKAIEKGWDTIKDPGKMFNDDMDEAIAFIDAHQETAAL